MEIRNKLSPNISSIFIILAILSQGLGNHLFSISFFTDISTFFIYLLLASLFFLNNISFPKHLLFLLLLIFVHSFLLNFGTNKFLLDSFLHFIGVVIYSISFFSFISLYKNNLDKLFSFLYNFSFWMAIIGTIQMILYVLFNVSFIPLAILSNLNLEEKFTPDLLGFLPRVSGIFLEPSHYAVMLLPGAYISILNLSSFYSNKFNTTKFKSIVILIGLLFSFSFVGFIGLFLVIISISHTYYKGSFKRKFTVYLILMLLFSAYSKTSLVYKLDSTFNQASMINEIDSYNYTSSDNTAFSVISNLIVASNALKMSYFLGTGINTHKNTYDNTIYDSFNFGQFEIELNKKDAGSLIIRLFSEFGIIGFLCFLYFLIKFKIKQFKIDNIYCLMNILSLTMIIAFSLRNGGYLSIFLNLFCALYYYSYREYNKTNAHY